MIRSAVPVLAALLAMLLVVAPTASFATSADDCRAMQAVKRKTALERWRGPRANANKYPTYCENERFLGMTPSLPNVQFPEGGGGFSPGFGGVQMPTPGAR